MRTRLTGRPIALAASLLGASVAPALVGAQGPPPLPRAWAFTWGGHQVRLGVLVNTETDAATDTLGARVEAVTPGGPAGNAGLKAGDVLTRFNGVPLGRIEGTGDAHPGQRLIDLVRALEPGDSVQLEYRRGDEMHKATLVAEATALGGPVPTDGQGMARVELPGGPMGLPFFGPGANLSFCFGDAWCDMELVNLNPDLGEYFGTKEGILVIKAPRGLESALEERRRPSDHRRPATHVVRPRDADPRVLRAWGDRRDRNHAEATPHHDQLARAAVERPYAPVHALP